MTGKPHKGKYDDIVSSFIDEFWKREFRSPTLREIIETCGTKSTSVTRHVVRKIAKARGDVIEGCRITPGWVIEAIRKAGVTV